MTRAPDVASSAEPIAPARVASRHGDESKTFDGPSLAQVVTASGGEAGTAIPDGARFGRHRLGPLLGQGGMGVAFSAFDPELARTVARKVLLTGRDGAERERSRLRPEAQIMARRSHPDTRAPARAPEGSEHRAEIELGLARARRAAGRRDQR